jgi:hypothetical protein
MDCETLDDRTAVADYISDLTAELALLAAWAEHTNLARILEMARLEAEQIRGQPDNTAGEPAPGDGPRDVATGVTNSMVNDLAVPGDAQTSPFECANVIRLPTLRAARR